MEIRTKQDKQDEVKKIILKLTDLQLTTIYEPIRELFRILKLYVEESKDIKINIKFPEIRKNIVGYLAVNKSKECWLKITSDS
jgi:Flp pilus assembly secretin CpaC